MPLQSSLSLLRRSPNPFLLLRMCLVLLQPLPAHMCKFFIQLITDIAHATPKTKKVYVFLNTFLCDCTERAFKPVRFVTVWSEACMDSGNWDTLGHLLSGWPTSHQVLHCLSPGMMTCLPLDFQTPPVWRHSLTTQVELKTLYYYLSLVYKIKLLL